MAKAVFERLAEYIIDFEKLCNEKEEVGARLVCFGETMVLHVDSVGYYNPELICFYGQDASGQEVQLIQHISQLSFLLVKVPRSQPTRERVGFRLANELAQKE